MTIPRNLSNLAPGAGSTGVLDPTKGGTGAATLTANNVLLGNGTSAPLFVAPSTNGNVLTSNGTTWASTAPAASGVSSFSAGTTGFTPSSITTGVVTLAGTLAAASGGTGVVNNAAMTVTGAGNFAYTRTLTAATNVTFPTTGTLSTLAGTETLTNKTLTNMVFDGDYTEDVFTITDSASVDLDPSNGTVQVWTLGASRSPTATGFASGQSITLLIDDGSAYAITWPSVTWKTDGGVAPTLNTTGYTVIQLWKVSAVLYGARVGDA